MSGFIGVALRPAENGEKVDVLVAGCGKIGLEPGLRTTFRDIWQCYLGPGLQNEMDQGGIGPGSFPTSVYSFQVVWLPDSGYVPTIRLNNIAPRVPVRYGKLKGTLRVTGLECGRPHITGISESGPFAVISFTPRDGLFLESTRHFANLVLFWDARLHVSRYSELLLEWREDTVGDPQKAFDELWERFKPTMVSLVQHRGLLGRDRLEEGDLQTILWEAVSYVTKRSLLEYVGTGLNGYMVGANALKKVVGWKIEDRRPEFEPLPKLPYDSLYLTIHSKGKFTQQKMLATLGVNLDVDTMVIIDSTLEEMGTRTPKRIERMQKIILMKPGFSVAEIASELRVSRSTVEKDWKALVDRRRKRDRES